MLQVRTAVPLTHLHDNVLQACAGLIIPLVQATFLLPHRTGHERRRTSHIIFFKGNRQHLSLTAADPDPGSPGRLLG